MTPRKPAATSAAAAVVTASLVATLTNGATVELACTDAFLDRVAVDPPALERALCELDAETWTLTACGGYVRSGMIAIVHLRKAPAPA